jgi:predicted RNA-binding protein Jag
LKQNKIIITILVKHKKRIFLRGKKKRNKKISRKSKPLLELKLSWNIWSFEPDLSCWWSGYVSQQNEDFRKTKDDSKTFGGRLKSETKPDRRSDRRKSKMMKEIRTKIREKYRTITKRVHFAVSVTTNRCCVTNFVKLTTNQDGSLQKITSSVSVAC